MKFETDHCNAPAQARLVQRLACAGSGPALRPQVHWLAVTGSTNDDMKQLLRSQQSPEAAVIVADCQTHGHGTHGRTWTAPREALLMTVAAPLACPVDKARGLTLALGAAAVDVLRAIEPRIALKWPNDIWLDGKKACGISCEICRNAGSTRFVVAGIGINLVLDGPQLQAARQPGGYRAAALLDHPLAQADMLNLRVELAAALCGRFWEIILKFSPGTVRDVSLRWPQLDALAGRGAVLTLPGGRVCRGRVAGIGPMGQLRMATGAGIEEFVDGTLRPATDDGESK